MGKITIHSAKFLKEKAIIDYTEERSNNLKPVRRNDEFKDIPHPDLILCYRSLAIHAAILAEFIPPQKSRTSTSRSTMILTATM